MSSLYRLDQIRVIPEDGEAGNEQEQAAEQTGWNELPGASRALLITLPCIWLVIGGISLYRAKKTKRKN